MSMEEQKELYGYVGSYTNDVHKTGITLFKLDRQNGVITLLETYTDLPNASFLALNADRTVLYAVSETDTI